MSDVNAYQYLFKCVIIKNLYNSNKYSFHVLWHAACVGLKKSCRLGSFQFTVNSTLQCDLFNSDSGFCIQVSLPHSYLLFLCFLQISPFLCSWLKSTLFICSLTSPIASCLENRSKSYTVMTSRLSSELCVWNLQTEYIWVCIYLTSCSVLLNDYCPNSTLWICMLWPL